MVAYSCLVLCWSLAALAVSITGIKKASMKITLAGQLMGAVGILAILPVLFIF